MYKGNAKGFKQIIDIADFYLCEISDKLWGFRIHQIANRIYSEKRPWKWHERIAFITADYLPPRIMDFPNFIRMRIWKRRIRRLETKLGIR